MARRAHPLLFSEQLDCPIQPGREPRRLCFLQMNDGWEKIRKEIAMLLVEIADHPQKLDIVRVRLRSVDHVRERRVEVPWHLQWVEVPVGDAPRKHDELADLDKRRPECPRIDRFDIQFPLYGQYEMESLVS